ncbi:hypothetical protein ACH42_08585 [Endozoicomonas sp. (ex Bugula neritina AB1)]|nr:hypothetical protein ACH42_08585 [Endozoicomonas sp. (ex Bugula neritina AB1)]
MLLLSGQVLAETRYITDVILVPMRAGPGNQYKILHRGLKTGTELTMLEEEAGNGFSKVLRGSQEGYVRTQYIVREEPARRLLPGIQEKAAKSAVENKELRQELALRDSRLQELTAQVAGSEEQLAEQKAEMRRIQEITADPMAIDRRNKQLIEENFQLKNQVQVLQAENIQLVEDNSTKWYLYGGGTILLGIILGLILPLLRVRKKPSDWA